jgi:hypothetical protein
MPERFGGVLWHAGSAEEEAPYLNTLRQGLRDLGYVEGRNMVLENRFPNEFPSVSSASRPSSPRSTSTFWSE